MQSSYSVIKSNSVLQGEEKTIMTQYNRKIDFEDADEVLQQDMESTPEVIARYRQMGEDIVNDAKVQRDSIINAANINAVQIEKDAYEKGYSQGKQNGYEDGYKEAYDKNIEAAKAQAADIVSQAMNILNNANNDYEEYLKEKTQEIIHLSMKMAEAVLKTKLEVPDGISDMVRKAIEGAENTKTFIIRCNEVHVDELKAKVDKWKVIYAIEGNIFVIGDETISPGNAVIERDNGRTEVGIQTGLDKIKEAIL